MKQIENIDEKIDEISEELLKLEKIKKRIANIDSQLELLYNDLAHRKNMMNREWKDVVKLENRSSSMLFKNILGDQKNQLEIEQKEYLQAVLEYNAVAREIELYTFEKEVLIQKNLDDKPLLKNLDYYLQIKEKRLLFHNKGEYEKIRILNKELDALYFFKRELKQAQTVANIVQKEVFKAYKKLDKVSDGAFSKIGKRRRVSYALGKYLDQATEDAANINFHLKKLDKELSDVYTRYSFISIHKFENFVNTFFDSLITDWIRRNRLQNALKCLEKANEQIANIQSRLNLDMQETDTSIEEKIKQKRQIVKSN